MEEETKITTLAIIPNQHPHKKLLYPLDCHDGLNVTMKTVQNYMDDSVNYLDIIAWRVLASHGPYKTDCTTFVEPIVSEFSGEDTDGYVYDSTTERYTDMGGIYTKDQIANAILARLKSQKKELATG